MTPWMAWFNEYKQEIVEMGAPTGNELNVTKTGSSKPGIYISGYTVIQAQDVDAVKGMLSDHPQFVMDANSIGILEILPTLGM